MATAESTQDELHVKGGVDMNNLRIHGWDHANSHDKLVESCLEKIQKEVGEDKAKMVVAVHLATGQYALGIDSREALAEFRKRWPDLGYYMCRVDGGPSGRM